MISQTVEYALRAVVYLADQGEAARTTQQIAEATRVPPAYLSKVMQGLSRGKLVHSQRGLHGGFTLAREPKDRRSCSTIRTFKGFGITESVPAPPGLRWVSRP